MSKLYLLAWRCTLIRGQRHGLLLQVLRVDSATGQGWAIAFSQTERLWRKVQERSRAGIPKQFRAADPPFRPLPRPFPGRAFRRPPGLLRAGRLQAERRQLAAPKPAVSKDFSPGSAALHAR